MNEYKKNIIDKILLKFELEKFELTSSYTLSLIEWIKEKDEKIINSLSDYEIYYTHPFFYQKIPQVIVNNKNQNLSIILKRIK